MPTKVERFDELKNAERQKSKNFNGEKIIQLNHFENLSVECNFCLAKKFEFESPNMCCFNGKVHVEVLPRRPQVF